MKPKGGLDGCDESTEVLRGGLCKKTRGHLCTKTRCCEKFTREFLRRF